MKKKIVAGLLSVTMVFGAAGVLPAGVIDLGTDIVADAAVSGDYVYSKLTDGTVAITGYNGTSTNVIIPEKLDGKTVSAITDAAFYNSKIKTVTIPATVKTIGQDSFRESAYLTTVTFSGGTTSIGSYTFYNCTSLTSVKLPSGLELIDNYVFYGCSALKSLDIPDSVSTIGSYCFENCSELESVTLPSSLTEIQDDTFAWCTSLKSIRIPNNVKSIGWRAFSSCTSMDRVIMPNSVKTLAEDAFNRCKGLKEISIPNSVTSIGKGAFENCTSLFEVVIPSSVTEIGDHAFGFIHATGAENHDKIGNFTVFGSTSTAQNYAAAYSFKYVDVRMDMCKATIPTTKYTYTKKGVKPKVTVKNSAGDTLKKDTDYTISYKGNKKCGKASMTVTGRGKYTGSIGFTFTIKPSKAVLKSVKSTKTKQVKVVWKKNGGGVTGYQVKIALDKKFKKGAKTYTIKKKGAAVKTINGLKKGKIYFVKVRAFKKTGTTKYNGKWSKMKKVKCK